MTARDANPAYGLTPKMLAGIPIMLTLPGIYARDGTYARNTDGNYGHFSRRHRLVSQERARELAGLAYGGEQGLTTYLSSNVTKAKLAYEQRKCKLGSAGNVDTTFSYPTGFMATTQLPYLDLDTHTTQVGRSCQRCDLAVKRAVFRQRLSTKQLDPYFDRRNRTYTEKGFLQHLQECADARSLSQSGKAASRVWPRFPV
ncbi:hypothetical protein DFH29DRAFT_92392 [Suillus ampliporus]|nr:hypothetical protein DFH29DRAFT_92392 [Suillus ampliporus]